MRHRRTDAMLVAEMNHHSHTADQPLRPGVDMVVNVVGRTTRTTYRWPIDAIDRINLTMYKIIVKQNVACGHACTIINDRPPAKVVAAVEAASRSRPVDKKNIPDWPRDPPY